MTNKDIINIIDKELNRGEIINKTYDKEVNLQNKIITLLKKIPKVWYTKVSDRYITGVPDIIGCINGKFFALELKATKGRASKLQEYNINKIKEAGGSVCIVRTQAECLEILKSTLMT